MKTNDLIELLAHDAAPQWPFHRLFGLALLGAVAIAGALFLATVGPRPDLAHALETVRFSFKFVVTLTLAIGAIGLSIEMARPGARIGPWTLVLAAAPLLLLAGVAAELAAVPREDWMMRMVGRNSTFCLRVIPLLAVGPLGCFLLVLRRGAPSNPGRAGALAGLAAGGVAATFYAAHCPDDSPLFLAVWYAIAIMVVTMAGYLCGRRLLRW